MAAVTVFVDDAVTGDLPALCVVTGRSTDEWLVIRHRIGGMPAAAWLLLLLGPVGVVILLVVAITTRAETLSVTVPFHDDELRLYRRARITQAGLLGSAVASFALSFGFWGIDQALIWLLVGAGCLLAGAAVGAAARHRQPGIQLDASRRWVTLWRVHPDFAASYSRSRSAARESASAGDLSGR